MSPTRRPGFALLAVAIAAGTFVTLLPAPARAQSVPGQEVARQLFEEGVVLENQKSYAGALAKFREAEQIRATPALRFHEAFCLENMGKLAAALDEYEAAERTAKDQNKAETLRSARERLQALRPRVPQVSVRLVAPPNAEVLLDGVAIASPLLANGTKFRVDPGEHQLVARAPEHVTRTQRLELVESGSAEVEIALQRGAATPASAPPAAKPAEDKTEPARPLPEPQSDGGPRPKRSLVLPIATTAGAAALVASGVAAFLVSGAKADDARAVCPTKLSCEDERSTVRTFDALALTGFVSGAALAGLSVVLWMRKPKTEATAPTPHVRVGPSGIFVEGAL